MMTKTAYYMQMAQEAAAQITGSKEQWTAFLTHPHGFISIPLRNS